MDCARLGAGARGLAEALLDLRLQWQDVPADVVRGYADLAERVVRHEFTMRRPRREPTDIAHAFVLWPARRRDVVAVVAPPRDEPPCLPLLGDEDTRAVG